ncbi:uncharacterized protein LOC114280614 [Camellia sinensis]|uniref:uncharacterized protein LOC114280614 n=1 Tax=Camellia sinensis TaxID=4442 RepID=UPI001036A0E5|nr:uncharacterized protein LOC114280614 [Camellia sinensis]
MAVVARMDLELHQLDVKIAFLNGELKEKIYMIQPDGFQNQVQHFLLDFDMEELQTSGSSNSSNGDSNISDEKVFDNKDELLTWVHDIGRINGFVIIIRTSDYGGGRKRPRIYLAFCGLHNHPAAEHLQRHSYAGRLSANEKSLLVDMSKSLVKLKEILITLKQRDALNMSTMKTVYNVRHRCRVLQKAGRSQMQQLLGKLAKHKYIERHRCEEGSMPVTDLFWAHPVSLDLLCTFPRVLIMDCTYKTNRYRLPLLEIVGVTSTHMTFSVAIAYLQTARVDNYAWAL